MKRFFQFIGVLIIMVAIFAIGAYGDPYTDPVPTPAPTISPNIQQAEELDPTIQALNGLVPATIEYGVPTIIKHNSDPLHAYIRFPQAGNQTDNAIAEWAHILFNNVSDEMDAVLNTNPTEIGEINVHFDSFLIDNRYVGIFQYGFYVHTLAGTPIEVLHTFNIDLLTNEFLAPSDILNFNEMESILDLLDLRLMVEHPATVGNIHNMNENWLSYIFIGHEGIGVIIPQHAGFLPETFDTVVVTLPYESLGTNLLIRDEPPLPPPTDAPEEPPEDYPEETIPPIWDDIDDGAYYPDEDALDEDGYNNENVHSDEYNYDQNAVFDDEVVEEIIEEIVEEIMLPDPTAPTVYPQDDFIDPSLPMIALTFDNGPSAYLPRFLDLLERYNVRATFCVVGNLVNTQPDTLLRAVGSGNEIIGNSWNHRNLAKLTDDDVRAQIEKTADAIEEITGTRTQLFRPPYGQVSDTMRHISEEMGFAMVNWSVDSHDWRAMDVDEIVSAVMDYAYDGAIVMGHEVFGTTLEAFERIIPELLMSGFQIVTVSELLMNTFDEIESGRVYFSTLDVS
jgi:peptidoglycan/xylan/chitin deacetylase (PgdA/CDA1 family)